MPSHTSRSQVTGKPPSTSVPIGAPCSPDCHHYSHRARSCTRELSVPVGVPSYPPRPTSYPTLASVVNRLVWTLCMAEHGGHVMFKGA